MKQNQTDCYHYTDEETSTLNNVSFWMDGVLQIGLSSLGIIGNIAASYVIGRRSMRNPFNVLLICLSMFDTTYLCTSILESIRSEFHGAVTDFHTNIFPYFLYPLHQTAFTASVFMTVAIACERFIAVHYPYDYNEAIHIAHPIRHRLIKYLLPVMLCSILFNITKFLEVEIYPINSELEGDINNDTVPIKNVISVSTLRMNPIYSAVQNWSRLLLQGLIPLMLLIYFNIQICHDVNLRRCKRKQQRLASLGTTTVEFHNINSRRQNVKKNLVIEPISDKFKTTRKNDDDSFFQKPQERMGFYDQRKQNEIEALPRHGVENVTLINEETASRRVKTDAELDKHEVQAVLLETQIENEDDHRRHEEPVVVYHQNPGRPKNMAKNSSTRHDENRRRFEDHLALIFVGFVFVFLICHLPRVILDIHEIVTLSTTLNCRLINDTETKAIPWWTMIMISTSHMFLTINSSTNILVYCLLSSRFRDECTKIFSSFSRTRGQLGAQRKTPER